MKKSILFLGAILLLAACQHQSQLEQKKAEMTKLQTQQASIAEQITKLQAEIAKLDTSAKKNKVIDVVVTPVALQPFSNYVEIQGKVDADQNVTVSAQAAGTVKAIYKREGDDVSVGQVVAELDDAVMSKSIDEVKSNLSLATDLYNKQKNLWDQKIGSEVQYLTAKNNKESLENRLKTLNEQLDLYKIKSPINGKIDEMILKVGQVVAPGMPSVRVVNLSNLKAKAEVSETYADKVHEGNEVMVDFPDINKEVAAKVSFVSKAINVTNRTFTVEVQLESNQDYHPNMVVVLKIVDYKIPQAVVLPINVVQNSENGNYVFVAVKDGNKTTAHRVSVKVGKVYNGSAEITDGIKVGDQVITTGYQDVEDGETLSIK